MVTDPISDLLVRLRNGFRRHHDVVTVPASKLKREVLRVLQAEGYIQGIDSGTEDGHPVLKVQLRYVGEGQPMITGMQRVSKPGTSCVCGDEGHPPCAKRNRHGDSFHIEGHHDRPSLAQSRPRRRSAVFDLVGILIRGF